MTAYFPADAGRPGAIYRSAFPDLVRDGIDTTGDVVRPPLYVPNVVDNLWEWQRPIEFPSRRMSAFASPTPQLARQGGPPQGKVYQVDLASAVKVCQLQGYRNSRDHPEATSLPILLYERLGADWIAARMEEKDPAGRLWLPCLSQAEVEQLFADVHELRIIRAEMLFSIQYWNHVRLLDSADFKLDPEGEVFFEAPNGYRMRLVD